MRKGDHVAILGARSLVGPYLCRALAARGFTGACLTRAPTRGLPQLAEGFHWRALEPASTPEPGDAAGAWRANPGALIVSLAPLWALAEFLPRLEGAGQLIGLGTTSLLTKQASVDPAERALTARLAEAEAEVAKQCAAFALPWTILRPTMIYDGVADGNICAIARFIERFGFFPIAHGGRGLRQPIHAEDVADAILAAIDNDRAHGLAINLPGGERMSYREMVRRVFKALSRRPVILSLPASVLKLGMRLGGVQMGGSYSTAMIERMGQDLVFDGDPARALLGTAPRQFHPVIARG